MGVKKNQLSRAFVEDHKILTRGFSKLASALKSKDLDKARRLAAELNEAAGPHIAFEEEVLYPEIARHRGEGFASQMQQEHNFGLQAILRLTSEPREVDEVTRRELIEDAEQMLDHAISCGTLLSYVTALPDERQRLMLARLLELREERPTWTKLSRDR